MVSSRKNGKRLTTTERVQAQETFLNAYTLNGNIMLSCRRANVNRSTFYQWCEHDVEFSVLYHTAEKDFADLALAEFVKRAMQGYEKPVVSMGKAVFIDGKPLTERVASDTLLAMLVKRHFPEYREKSAVVNITTTPKEYINLPNDDGNEQQ